MESRRQFLSVLVTTAVLTPVAVWFGRSLGQRSESRVSTFPRDLPDVEWRRSLPADAYHVLREAGTERPFSSPLTEEKRAGTFLCAGCESPVFDSDAKFDSGTGWPSFLRPVTTAAVTTRVDRSYYQVRTEVVCATCGGHLGHVFPDGPPPTGLRYCLNGVALRFHPVTS
jgi:peptide-methionine (R)-S-oxide reductase